MNVAFESFINIFPSIVRDGVVVAPAEFSVKNTHRVLQVHDLHAFCRVPLLQQDSGSNVGPVSGVSGEGSVPCLQPNYCRGRRKCYTVASLQ